MGDEGRRGRRRQASGALTRRSPLAGDSGTVREVTTTAFPRIPRMQRIRQGPSWGTTRKSSRVDPRSSVKCVESFTRFSADSADVADTTRAFWGTTKKSSRVDPRSSVKSVEGFTRFSADSADAADTTRAFLGTTQKSPRGYTLVLFCEFRGAALMLRPEAQEPYGTMFLFSPSTYFANQSYSRVILSSWWRGSCRPCGSRGKKTSSTGTPFFLRPR